MAMNVLSYRPNEEGSTLLETLVALVIFGSVLLPLSGMIAALMLDERPRQLQVAFDEARAEFCAPVSHDSSTTPVVRMARGLVIRREVQRHGISAEIQVTVSPASNTQKVILVMHRIIIVSSSLEGPLKQAVSEP